MSFLRYHSILLWDKISVDSLIVVMWFGTFSSLGMRMQTRGLVCFLFLTKATWFGIPDFRDMEEKWVGP